MKKTLNYNENKVQKGTAVCIGANGFLLPVNKMNFYNKQDVFENRNSLNERATTKTLHVSLNFSSSEHYETGFLMNIAHDYMSRIGFGEQPYLVYQHHDAGHPHIHILATTIREDGTRINTHNIGRNQSEMARKVLEQKYGLIKAENSLPVNHKAIVPFDLAKIEYGRSEIRRGIANVLHGVLGAYNYINLPQLNAILEQFNICADSGEKDSFMYSKRGLLYRVLDADGNKIGVPVKASNLPGSPTLDWLEKRFENNKKWRDPLREKLQLKLDNSLQSFPANVNQLSSLLLNQNIKTITRKSEDGRIYGITFVDNQDRSVFNGSEIGRQYSIAGLMKQMTNPAKLNHQKTIESAMNGFIEFNGLSPFAELINPETDFNPTPYQFKKRKKKKKR